MRVWLAAAVAFGAIGAAHAQREAISPSLSPDAVAQVFGDAVIDVCAAAVSDAVSVGALADGEGSQLASNTDPETRRLAGAGADETVWDVLAGKGVVTVHEGEGRCGVSAYGRLRPRTLSALSARLVSQAGFVRLVEPANGVGVSQRFMRMDGGRRVVLLLSGSEPGMPGHQSRFSVVTARVSASGG